MPATDGLDRRTDARIETSSYGL